MSEFTFSVLGVHVGVMCPDEHTHHLMELNFGLLRRHIRKPNRHIRKPNICYEIDSPEIDSQGINKTYRIKRFPHKEFTVHNDAEFLYHFEKDLTIELQLIRQDLFFIHGAAMAYKNKAFLIVAPSGAGKSTLAWALAQSDCRYLSDELAPIEIDSLSVAPFPHAFCLKQAPPEPYILPENAFVTERAFYVPAKNAVNELVSLKAIFFINYNNETKNICAPVSSGEGSARLFANSLNPLAHKNSGLAAARNISLRVSSFQLNSNILPTTCEQIKSTMAGLT